MTLVFKDLLDLEDLLVNVVTRVILARWASRVKMDHQAIQETLVSLASRVCN